MITSKIIQSFVKLAKQKLSGNWILLGGTVLHYFNKDLRVTTDIDIYRNDSKSSNADQLELMKISESLNLPVETINISAGFFLEKMKDYSKHLVLIEESKKFKLYRPDLYLFCRLKIQRLSEGDLQDCIEYAKLFKEEKNLQKKKICELIESSMSKMNESQKIRANQLLRFLN